MLSKYAHWSSVRFTVFVTTFSNKSTTCRCQRSTSKSEKGITHQNTLMATSLCWEGLLIMESSAISEILIKISKFFFFFSTKQTTAKKTQGLLIITFSFSHVKAAVLREKSVGRQTNNIGIYFHFKKTKQRFCQLPSDILA